ncbi:MAG: peptidylprolyl isomerase [Acidobacteriota bacterium]
MKTLLLLLTALVAFGQAPAADPVVMTVGTEKITRSMFEQIIGTLNEQQKAALQTPEARRSLAEQIAELKLMAQESRRQKLDQQPAVQMKIVLQAEQVLANAVYQELLKASPDEAALRAFYKEHEKEWIEAKGRHILVRFEGSRVPVREGQKELNDAEALAKVKDLRAKIVAGASFAETAKKESDDQGSGENGGELGSFGPGQMVEEFDQVAFDIPLGQVSEPIKTAFGYHLILIDSRGAKSFDEVRGTIEEQVKPEMGQKAIEGLKNRTPVIYDEGYFGKASAPPVPPN